MSKVEDVLMEYQRAVGALHPYALGHVRMAVTDHLWICVWFDSTLGALGCKATPGQLMQESRTTVVKLEDKLGPRWQIPRPRLLSALLYGAAVDLMTMSVDSEATPERNRSALRQAGILQVAVTTSGDVA
jgi:hypothetical protein